MGQQCWGTCCSWAASLRTWEGGTSFNLVQIRGGMWCRPGQTSHGDLLSGHVQEWCQLLSTHLASRGEVRARTQDPMASLFVAPHFRADKGKCLMLSPQFSAHAYLVSFPRFCLPNGVQSTTAQAGPAACLGKHCTATLAVALL